MMVRWRRWRRRVGLFVAALLMLGVLGAVSAAAIPTGRDCLDPKRPENPYSTAVSGLDSGPSDRREGDPFVVGSQASLYDRYHYAGYQQVIFDTPNVMDFCQPIKFDKDLDFGNTLRNLSLVVIAGLTTGTRLVTDGSFGALWDPLQQAAVATVGRPTLLWLLSTALAIGAVLTGWRMFKRMELSEVMSWVMRAGTAFVIAIVCMFYTIGVGGFFDSMIRQGFSAASEVTSSTLGRQPADAVASTMLDRIMYPLWQDAMFGGHTDVRKEYSERLWKAGSFTVEEQDEINRNPSTAASRVDDKREEYRTVLLEIKDKHPQAYPQVAGMDTSLSTWSSLPGVLAVVAAGVFLLVCIVRIAWGTVIARIAIGVFPLFAIPAMLPGMHTQALAVAKLVARAFWQGLVYTVLFFIYLHAGVGWILAADQHGLVKAIMVALMTGVLLALAKVAKAEFPKFPGVPGRSGSRGRRGGMPLVPPGGSGSGEKPGPEFDFSDRRSAPPAAPRQAPDQDLRRNRPATIPAVGGARGAQGGAGAQGSAAPAGELRSARRGSSRPGGRALPAGGGGRGGGGSRRPGATAAVARVASKAPHPAARLTAAAVRRKPGSKSRTGSVPPPARRGGPGAPGASQRPGSGKPVNRGSVAPERAGASGGSRHAPTSGGSPRGQSASPRGGSGSSRHAVVPSTVVRSSETPARRGGAPPAPRKMD